MSIEEKLFGRLKDEVALTKSTGVVDTTGTAVAWVSGDKFGAWAGQPITIDGVVYIITSVTDDENIVLSTTAGNQTGVIYAHHRVYAGTAFQKTEKPYIVFMKVAPFRDYTHNGFSGLHRPMMQISCLGDNYDSAKDVVAQVITALESWPGNDNVDAAFVEGETDMYERDTGLYHCLVDVYLWNRN